VLDRNGFSSFTVAENGFDPKRQRVMQRTSTDDPTRDRTISERIRKAALSENRLSHNVSCFST
jgi:hypothetical protein